MLRFVVLSALCLCLVECHKRYLDSIPNGHNVPNPCKTGEIWKAVGHNDVEDGHTGENVFGSDYHHNGKTWSKILCEMDSDKDGKTNGEELGDPSCIWTTSGNHNPQPPTGHPGICEPVGSPACATQGFTCAGGFIGAVHHGHHKG